MKGENFKAENVDEVVWLRLNRFRSVKLCENLIRKKFENSNKPAINESLIKSKAVGLSSAIDSAIGYWQVNSPALNAKILSRYYFLLQMTIAEQVSSIKNSDDLKAVQRHTEYGHGLATIIQPSLDFPDNYFTFAVRGGHFYSYANAIGVDAKKFAFEKRPWKFSDVNDPSSIVNLIDLFRRIPELNTVIEEYTGKPPLAFHVGHSNRSFEADVDAVKKHIQKTGKLVFQAPATSNLKTTYINFYTDSPQVTVEYLRSLGLGLGEFQVMSDALNPDEKFITAKLSHPAERYWYQELKTYSSSYAPTSIVAPLWNETTDNIILNYTLLYTLSIIVRYLPDHWYRINSGDLNHLGSLIDYYISTVDHILPLQMLERITETRISVHQPGSIFGPI